MPYAHYVASKHGVVGLMKAFANELGPHRIRVNTIHPTRVNSAMGSDPSVPEVAAAQPLFVPGATNSLPDLDGPMMKTTRRSASSNPEKCQKLCCS